MKIGHWLSSRAILSLATFCFVLFSLAAGLVAEERSAEGWKSGRVYAMANRAEGNTIVVFQRAEDGALKVIQEVSTGGRGSGPGQLPAPFPPVPAGNSTTTQDEL